MTDDTKIFKKTGRNVTVSRNDLLNDAINKLKIHDTLSEQQKKNNRSPYKHTIYTKVEGSRTVEIPKDIQIEAIKKWNINKQMEYQTESQNGAGAHTRLARRTRYSGLDPFIMNQEIAPSDNTFDCADNFLIDQELSKLYEQERQRKKVVGYVKVADDRYGKGGSYGDLPRDFEIFNRDVSVNMEIHPDPESQSLRNKSGGLIPNQYQYQDQYKENGLKFQDQVLSNNRKAVGSRRVAGSGMNQDTIAQASMYKLLPGNMMNNDLSVENCAPIDTAMNMLIDSESECLTCDLQDNNLINGVDTLFGNVEEPLDEEIDSNEMPLLEDVIDEIIPDEINDDMLFDNMNEDMIYDGENYDGENYDMNQNLERAMTNVKLGKYDYYDDVNRKNEDGYENTLTDVYERHDADCSYDSMYKYLFFILLIIIIFLIYNYKHNGGRFNFDFIKKH